MGDRELGQGSTMQSFGLSLGGRRMGSPWPVREQHLQSGLSQLVHPVSTRHPLPVSGPTLLPLTQTGPPRGPGTSAPPSEASGPRSFLPHPASYMEPGSKLSTTLGGGWEHWCLAQGGSWKA